jgi:hypothetical protein
MRYEDHSPSGDRPGPDDVPPPPPAPEPGARRRRPARSWSTPPPSTSPQRFDLPTGEDDWSFGGRRRFGVPPTGPTPGTEVPPPPPGAAAPPTPSRPPSLRTAIGAPPAPSVDLGAVSALLGQLRSEVAQIRTALAAGAADRDGTLVTGGELAVTIEALGNTLGNGMATLLTEHRNLLARDLDAAADRILEELGQRLRTSTTQTVDGVEERLRQVTSKAVGDLSEQLDLRLDQLQTDVAGLRAVMLELPDQTAVAERLDQLVEAVGSARNRDTTRVSPALGTAVERSVTAALEPLATELASLRRRITLRTKGDGVELSDAQLEALADRVAARLAGTAAPSAGRSALPVADEDDEDDLDDLDDLDDDSVEAPPIAPRTRATKAAPAAKRAGRRR